MIYNGIKIVESVLAVTRHQARVYPKRRANTPAHLKRMNKKWLKRYGYRQEPAMYLMRQPSLFGGLGEEIILAHPALAAKVRAELSETGKL